jgi:NitT/TauT family transport system ATP-binding protein
MTAALELRAVSKSFTSKRDTVVALHAIDLSLEENEFVTLVGPSGCGKSTLLAVTAGLEDRDAGAVLVRGTEVWSPGRDRGMVFQNYTLLPWLTVEENIAFALRRERLPKAEVQARVDEQLDLVGLTRFRKAQPRQLSGGMKQRVAIARALVYRPQVLLMDEPFGALDAQTRAQMQETLTDIWERHRITVLFITHDVDEAIFISDRVLVMAAHPGRIIEQIQVPLARPRHQDMQVTADFLGIKQQIITRLRHPGDAT